METPNPAARSLEIIPVTGYISLPPSDIRWTDIQDAGNRFGTLISIYSANGRSGREATEAMAKRIIKALAVLDAIELDAPKNF